MQKQEIKKLLRLTFCGKMQCRLAIRMEGKMLPTCRKCGERADVLIIYAMLKDVGCKVHPSPSTCSADGGEHDFRNDADLVRQTALSEHNN